MDMSSLTKLILMEKGRPPKVIFQLDVMHNLPTKLPQKSWMKNHFFRSPGAFKVIRPLQIGALGSLQQLAIEEEKQVLYCG
jgi:hypothetical protein